MTRRRVVTGVDAEGRSVIVSNGPSSGRFGDSGWEELWAFDGVPARLDDAVDPVDVPMFRLVPAKSQIAVRIFTAGWPDLAGVMIAITAPGSWAAFREARERADAARNVGTSHAAAWRRLWPEWTPAMLDDAALDFEARLMTETRAPVPDRLWW